MTAGAQQRRRPLVWGLLAVVLSVTAALVLARAAGPGAGPAPGPDPPPSSPPVTVRIDIVDVRAIDNDRLFGRKRPAAPEDAADAAVRQVGTVLRDYLDAQFVAAGTRLTAAPLAGLLSAPAQAALTAADRAGLGAVGTTVRRVETEPVTVQARVLTRGDDARTVVVTYELRARVDTGGRATVPLSQRATMVFVPHGDTWRADAVDAVLDLPLPSEAPS